MRSTYGQIMPLTHRYKYVRHADCEQRGDFDKGRLQLASNNTNTM